MEVHKMCDIIVSDMVRIACMVMTGEIRHPADGFRCHKDTDLV